MHHIYTPLDEYKTNINLKVIYDEYFTNLKLTQSLYKGYTCADAKSKRSPEAALHPTLRAYPKEKSSGLIWTTLQGNFETIDKVASVDPESTTTISILS